MILDTNVLSEPMRASPDARVMRWLDAQDIEACFITTITAGEFYAGLERLALGRKRTDLMASIGKIIDVDFAGRILDFDLPAARQWGAATERLRRQGLHGMQQDVMIASIALSTGNIVATRDTRPYEAAGVTVINPWDA